ncbi:MAG: hypothetical protein NTV00_02255 [Methylococcales bacterium]|nr:hypothetical protein [Methylococcales bacterium]
MSYLTLRNPKLGYCAALLILAAFKLWLASAIAILASTWAGHDDRLFINLAASRLS